jgi:hypothetical protein
MNHFSTKALRGDREGVMNLALTEVLQARGEVGNHFFTGRVETSIYRGST